MQPFKTFVELTCALALLCARAFVCLCRVVGNACQSGNADTIAQLVSAGFLPALGELLGRVSSETHVTNVALDALECILACGVRNSEKKHAADNSEGSDTHTHPPQHQHGLLHWPVL